LLQRTAERLEIPAGERVLIACRKLSPAELKALDGWYVIELQTPHGRWDAQVGRSFWPKIGNPHRLIAPHNGIGFPGMEFRNVLRFLAVQRGMARLAVDRDGREYRITRRSLLLAGTLGMLCWRQLALLLLSGLLAVMRRSEPATAQKS